MMNRPLTWFVNSPLWKFMLARLYLPPLFEAVSSEAPARILEAGCGCGDTTRMLLDRFQGALVVATDIDPGQIALARERVQDARAGFQVADVATLPFPDAAFDMVVILNTLHHVPGWRSGIAEAARTLKPGGALVAMDENTEAWGRLYTWLTGSRGFLSKGAYVEAARSSGLALEADLGSERIMRFVFRKARAGMPIDSPPDGRAAAWP